MSFFNLLTSAHLGTVGQSQGAQYLNKIHLWKWINLWTNKHLKSWSKSVLYVQKFPPLNVDIADGEGGHKNADTRWQETVRGEVLQMLKTLWQEGEHTCMNPYIITIRVAQNLLFVSNNFSIPFLNNHGVMQTWKKFQAVFADILTEITLFWGLLSQISHSFDWRWRKKSWRLRFEVGGWRMKHL